jgi:hypothetical protein
MKIPRPRPRPAVTRASARPALHRAPSTAPAVASAAGTRHLSAPEPARRIDRRRNRSSNLGQALHLQLEACRAEAALDAIVVADDLGICVAAASEDAGGQLEELAAWLPLSERAGLDRLRTPAPAGLAAPNALRRFVIGRSALFMCAVGGQNDARAACLLRAELGFRRILAAAG